MPPAPINTLTMAERDCPVSVWFAFDRIPPLSPPPKNIRAGARNTKTPTQRKNTPKKREKHNNPPKRTKTPQKTRNTPIFFFVLTRRKKRLSSKQQLLAGKPRTPATPGRIHLKSGVFWFVVYRKTARRHVASCEMDSGHWALRSLSFPGPFKSSCLVRTL